MSFLVLACGSRRAPPKSGGILLLFFYLLCTCGVEPQHGRQEEANADDDVHVPSYAYAYRHPRQAAVHSLLVRATPLVGATPLVRATHTVPD